MIFDTHVVCSECQCIGNERPCWCCGSDKQEHQPWQYTGGHHYEEASRRCWIPAGGAISFTDEEAAMPLPWQAGTLEPCRSSSS